MPLQVTLLDKSTKAEYKLPFGDRWLARDEDDSDIVRELPLTKEGNEPLPGMPPTERGQLSSFCGRSP